MGNITDTISQPMRKKICYRTYLKLIGSFVCAFVLSGTKIYDNATGLSVAFVGAAGAGAVGLASLLGSTIGYYAIFTFSNSAEYIASAVVVYTIAFICQYTVLFKNKHFMPAVVFVIIAIALSFGTVSTVRGTVSMYIYIFIKVVMAFAATYLYAAIFQLDHNMQNEKMPIYFLLFLSTIIMSANHVNVLSGLSLGRMVSVLCILVITYSLESFYGVITSIILGFAFYIEGNHLYYLLCVTTYVMVCVLINLKSRLIHASLFVLITVIAAAVNGFTEYSYMLQESITAAGVFLCIPKRMILLIKYMPCLQTHTSDRKHHEFINRTPSIEDLILEVSICMDAVLQDHDSVEKIDALERAVNSICTKCEKNDLCWTNHRLELEKMFFDIDMIAKNRGKITDADFNEDFLNYCSSGYEFASEINTELRKHYSTCIAERKAQENQIMISEMLRCIADASYDISANKGTHYIRNLRLEEQIQFYLDSVGCEWNVDVFENKEGAIQIELSGSKIQNVIKKRHIDDISQIANVRLRILKNATNLNRILLLEAEPYAVSVGIASKKKTGERVCGDCCSYFKTEQGIFYVILSDGLGAGEFAERQSSKVLHILERFLINGIPPIYAIQLLNTILAINNSSQLNCATIDLISIDLYSGKTCIYKLGAAPSFAISFHGVKKICGQAMSAGVDVEGTLQPDYEFLILKPNDVFVVTSDGITISDYPALKLLAQEEKDSMKNLARRILIEYKQKSDSDDDMTVIVIRMENRL